MSQKSNSLEIIIDFFRRVSKNGLFGSNLPGDSVELSKSQLLRTKLVSSFLFIAGLGIIIWVFKLPLWTQFELGHPLPGGPILVFAIGISFAVFGLTVWPWKK